MSLFINNYQAVYITDTSVEINESIVNVFCLTIVSILTCISTKLYKYRLSAERFPENIVTE